jgi:6-phosphogluconolactonase (cycloisomerase 2 family)
MNNPVPDDGGNDAASQGDAPADAPAEAAPPIDWNKEVRFLASIEPEITGGYSLRVEPPKAYQPSFTEIATDATPQMIVVLPAMNYAYVPLGKANGVDRLKVNPDTLAKLDTAPFTVGNDARFACAHPSSNFLYVTNFGDSTVSALKVAADGTLSASGAAAQAVAGPQACVVDPSGKILFVASRTTPQLSTFIIDAQAGTLSGRQDLSVPNDPIAVAIHPTLNVVYVASAEGNAISAFTYAANGALTANGSVKPGKADAPMPMGLAIVPSGAWLYSSNNADTVVNIWAVDAKTGALTAAGTADVPTGGRAITADPGSAWLFLHADDSHITIFDVDATTGGLTPHPKLLGGGKNPMTDAIFYTGVTVP